MRSSNRRNRLTARALLLLLPLTVTSGAVFGKPLQSPATESEPPQAEDPQPTELAALTGPSIAPSLDLKEVAPLPKPASSSEAFPESAIQADTDQQDRSEPVSQEHSDEDKLVILGSEVAPGTATRLSWTPDGNISGLATPTPVLVIRGKNPGKTMCMTAAVHGDELNGIEIVRRVMYDIDPENLTGNIIGLPIVNLQGFQRGSRYLSDRRDLNRYFPGEATGSLAARTAWSLFNEVIVHCDFLVDMHTGSLRRTNMPQIRADIRFKNVADFTDGFGKIAVVHSTGRPGMLRYAAVASGIPAATLEVGESLRIQEDQIDVGVGSINRLLEHEGMYSRRFTWGEPEPVYYKSSWIRAENGGILFSKKEVGDLIMVDEILGTITDPITNETSNILAKTSGRIIGMAVNQFVMPGYGCYHIGIEASEEKIAELEITDNIEGEVE